MNDRLMNLFKLTQFAPKPWVGDWRKREDLPARGYMIWFASLDGVCRIQWVDYADGTLGIVVRD